uniref:Dehydrogenase/reductase SDR family member 12-like n=1 Tax=Hippocampus comes TaxID=109280 RepID=A0A3Q2Z8C4_HIPCM
MSLYRNTIWFLNGMHQYTRSGYEAASQNFEPQDLDVSVVGRSFMVTGANSGIGKATAMAIAKKGGRVHMVCRNKDKAEEAKGDIIHESGNTEVYVHIVDLSESRKVWEFAEAFKKQYPSLHVLVWTVQQRIYHLSDICPLSITLGMYLLTESLIPLLQKSREPRVITVSSGGMLVQKLQIDDLQSEKGYFDGLMVYAQNKRQQVVLTEQWAKEYPDIHFSVMHPGWVDTPAVSQSMPQFHSMMAQRLRSPEQGADTVVWLALSRAAGGTRSGKFFQDRKAVPTHLPLAWTRSSTVEVLTFISQLEMLAKAVQAKPTEVLRDQVV